MNTVGKFLSYISHVVYQQSCYLCTTYDTSMNTAAAESLFETGDFEGATNALDELDAATTTTDETRFLSQILRARILRYQGESEEAIALSAELVETGIIRHYKWSLFDARLLYLECMVYEGQVADAATALENAETLFDRLCEGSRQNKKCLRREAILCWARALHEMAKGDLKASYSNLERSHEILKDLPSFPMLINVLTAKGVVCRKSGDLDKALHHYQGCRILCAEKGSLVQESVCLVNIGLIYRVKGELDQALKFFTKALEVTEKINYSFGIGVTSSHIAQILHAKGMFDDARSAYEKGLNLLKQCSAHWYQAWTLFYVIRLMLDYDDFPQAKQFLAELKSLCGQHPSPLLKQLHSVANALLLRKSGRATTVAQAQVVFEEVANGPVYDDRLNVLAMLNLCQMLLDEIRATGGREAFMELEEVVGRLAGIAREQESYSILAETYLLKSKLALVELKAEEARHYLRDAQNVAEQKQLVRLAKRISREHDELLAQLERWQQLISADASLRERIELAGLENLLDSMMRHGDTSLVESFAETPVMLLVVSQTGLTVYSKQFKSDDQLDDQILGGFVTALDTFLRQAFAAKGHMERIKHEEYTLLMKEEGPLTYCYVFKGLSYDAIKKLEHFVEQSLANDIVWEYLTADKVKHSRDHEILVDEMVALIF